MSDAPLAKRPRVEAVSEDSSTLQLLSWLHDNGGFFDGVRVVDAGSAGKRLIAARDLPSDSVFFRVPKVCVLSADNACAMAHGVRMQERFRLVVPEELSELSDAVLNEGDQEQSMVTKRSALYAALMVAPCGQEDVLGPLLHELCGCTAATPYTWGRDCGIEALEEAWADVPKTVKEEWCDHWDTLHIEYMMLFPALCSAFPHIFPEEKCSEADWMRAHSVYTSRAFPEHPSASSHDGVLVPLLDRMNHDSVKCNVKWCGVGLDEACGARTTRAVLAGEELFYSYGRKGNVELVLGYGFAVWGNPHELARICMDLEACLSEEDPKFEWISEKFEETLDRVVGHADFCRRDGTKVTFKVSSDDLADSCSSSSATAWTALCKVCTAMYMQVGKATPEDLLVELLSQASASLIGLQSPEAWEALVADVRSKDTLEVSEAASCACSTVGMTTALRHSQLTVVRAAIRKLASMAPLPRQGKVKGRGRGRGRRQRSGRKLPTRP